MAVNNFQLAVDRVDSLINGNPDLAVANLEQMLCELEVKFTSYETAHDKIVGSATDEQLGHDDYGNHIIEEHEALLKRLGDSHLKTISSKLRPAAKWTIKASFILSIFIDSLYAVTYTLSR